MLSESVLKAQSFSARRVNEVEQRIQFKLLHRPALTQRKSNQALQLTRRLVPEQTVEIHKRHLVIGLIARTRTGICLRDRGVSAVSMFLHQLLERAAILRIARNVLGSAEVRKHAQR